MVFHPRTGKSTINLNQDFVSQYADTPLKMAALILHELLHHMLHHYVLYPQDKMTNLAQDIVINSLICRLNPSFMQLFNDIYSKNVFPWLALRPGGNIKRIEEPIILEEVRQVYRKIHRKFNRSMGRYFANGGQDQDVFTVDDIKGFLIKCATIQKTKQEANVKAGIDEMQGLGGLDPDWWKEDKEFAVILLGNHNGDGTDALDSSELEEEHKDEFKDLLDDMVRDLSCNPNASQLFRKSFAIDKEDAPDELLEGFNAALREDVMRAKEIIETVVGPRPNRLSVVPKHVGRKEAALLSAGIWPTFWPAFGPDEKPQGSVAVYIDVSGSMGDQAEFILMLMTGFKEHIDTEFYQFSTVVEATPFGEFLKHYEETGEVFVTTTGGTAFDPIFQHAQDNQFKKVLLITDGCAGLSDEFKVAAQSIETFTVFTNDHTPEPLTEASKQTWVMPTIRLPKREA